MLREIITQANPSVTLQLPEEMVGKTVEVIAFEINEVKNITTRAQRLTQIKDLTKNSMTDLSKFKFDRDEANNYGD